MESGQSNSAPTQSNLKPNTPSITFDGHAENHYKPTNAPAPRKSGSMSAAIAVAIISLLIAGGSLAVAIVAMNRSDTVEPTTTASVNGYYTGNSVEFEKTSIAAIVEKVTPAVVSIVTETRTSSFFGRSSIATSAGTGMIVTSDGYVLTNKHVIDGAVSIQVITDAGDTFTDVDIVGTDPNNDVAYLKINNASNLPTITLGDSKTIAVGQPVLAIGNALGAYQNSVTQGIVSGTGRSVAAGDSTGANVEYLSDMVQTDAAINPGNSGGPLVNANGDVIGINTAVSTDAQGMGFAIPISATKGMLARITQDGKAERAYIGLNYLAITAEVAKEYNLPVKRGAYVKSSSSRSSAVVKGSPAEKAGIKDGDIITKINGVEIGTAGSVATLIGEYKAGDTISITLLRSGQEISVNVTLDAYPVNQ